LLIHAGKCKDWLQLAEKEPFASALARYGFNKPSDLPLGAIIALSRLKSVNPTESVRRRIDGTEKAFGDFNNGRFAWENADVRRLLVPIEVPGQQGLWDYDLTRTGTLAFVEELGDRERKDRLALDKSLKRLEESLDHVE
jgi:hypothetical protein